MGTRVDPYGLEVVEIRVHESMSQAMTDYPEGETRRKGTHKWDAKFLIRLNKTECKADVVLSIMTRPRIDDEIWNRWKDATESKWSGKFKLCCSIDCCSEGVTINVTLEKVEPPGVPFRAGTYILAPGPTTRGMLTWGRDDTVDVPHEVGHMLGNKDEYYTVDGTEYGAMNQPDGNIMNRSLGEPEAKHYGLIGRSVDPSCTVVRVDAKCPEAN